MAKRKTIQQKQMDKLTSDSLNELGRRIIATSSRNSKIGDWTKLSPKQKEKRDKHLRDSGNWRVKLFDTLIVSQNFYGRYNTPKGNPTPSNRKEITNTPLKNAIRDLVPDATKVYIKNMVDLLKSPIISKK